MKNKKQYLTVALAVVLVLALSLGIFVSCNKHTCEHPCSICDKCTNMLCKNKVCEDKCEGHGSSSGADYTKDMDIGENPNTFEEYVFPERAADEKQVVIYWREAEHNYSDNDMWIWFTGASGTLFEMHECSYGAVVVVNVPSATKELNYIIRSNSFVHTGDDWGGDGVGKILPDDQKVDLTGDVTTIYLTGANKYKFESTDGGKTLNMIRVVTKMSMKSFTEIDYQIAPSAKIENLSQIVVKCNGATVEIESLSSLGKNAASGTITLKNEIDLSNNYTVTIEGYGEQSALPSALFDSKVFGDKFNYDGELGAIIKDGSVDFKLWAPTASNVVLNIFEAGNGGSAIETITMTKPAADGKGVWSHHVEDMNDVLNKYYTYTVTTSAGEQEAVDPYAKSAGVNGMRGMIINPADANPQDWASASSGVVKLDSYTDAVIWETHVRDFSNTIEASDYKGKYLAFTETGLTNSHGVSVGVDYVKDLGVTHIHLLPVFDYKSVDEASNEPQFNWGYDPQNYNVPEGSYSTNPYDGAVRVSEFKQMVAALHAQGLGVVMDVVYNHTFDRNSNLNKVVPNYYYRFNADGTPSSGSGCGNDTASERYMFGKYMVDSASYWVEEYKLDGLRFDLMGLHDINTMQAIEQAVHKINPSAIIYGEGWDMDNSTAKNVGTILARQGNIKRITATEGSAGAIAVFNDVIRDGLRGSVFNSDEPGYLSNASFIAKVRFGLQGGETAVTGSGATWTVPNAAVINYISAHDNHTLWDRLRTPYLLRDADGKVVLDDDGNVVFGDGLPDNETLLARNRLGATIVMLSKGTPFMTAGEEMLRSKTNANGSFNDNSYNSSDEINNLKWENLTTDSDEYAMMQYYKGIIAMRKEFAAFRNVKAVVTTETLTYTKVVAGTDGADKEVKVTTKALVVKYTVDDGVVAVAVINGESEDRSYVLPKGNWSLVCDGTQAGKTEIASVNSDGETTQITVPEGSVHVYVAK